MQDRPLQRELVRRGRMRRRHAPTRRKIENRGAYWPRVRAFIPTDRPRVVAPYDGSLAAICEPARVTLVVLPMGNPFAVIETTGEVGWLGSKLLVTNKEMEGRALKEFRHEEFAGQLQVVRMERGGVPFPVAPDTELKRFDVLFVAGLKSAVDKVAQALGRVARPSTGTDLLTLSVGMILGLLSGGINLKVAGFSVGLGNAGGLLLSARIAGFDDTRRVLLLKGV